MPTYTVNLNDVVLSVNGQLPDGTGNVTITIPANTTMATENTVQDANRVHSAAGFTWTVNSAKQHQYNFTSAAASGSNFEINSTSILSTDKIFGANGGAGYAMEIRADQSTRAKRVVINDTGFASSEQLRVFNPSGNGADVYVTASSSRALVFQSDGVNGIGLSGSANFSGGVGAQISGYSIGLNASVTQEASTAGILRGYGLVTKLSDAGDRTQSAALEVRSTDKGFLKPQMTTTQRLAIPSPATGLVVGDTTTNSDWRYDGTNWIEQ